MKNLTRFQIIFRCLIIFLAFINIAAVSYLLGFMKGYTANNTKHEFVFSMGDETLKMTEAFNNMTYHLSPSDRSCLEGCRYAFFGISENKDTAAMNHFNLYECNIFCEEKNV